MFQGRVWSAALFSIGSAGERRLVSITFCLWRRLHVLQASPLICPVHTFGKLLQTLPLGTPLFPGITAKAALEAPRAMLARNNIPQAATYTTSDFRRGHAQDLVDAGWPFVALHFLGLASCSLGARIGEILREGRGVALTSIYGIS